MSGGELVSSARPAVAAPPRLLAVDPSSTATGYAVFRGQDLDMCGVIRAKGDVVQRVRGMVASLREVRFHMDVLMAVIEIPSGKVGHKHGGGGAGLSVYGFAAGYMLRALEQSIACVNVTDESWTRGRSKADRIAACALEYPKLYDATKDRGGDIADAICLGQWWLAQQVAREAR